MAPLNRRTLLRAAAGTAAWQAAAQTPERGKMRLGIILGVFHDPEAVIRRVHEPGFPTCRVTPRELDDATADKLCTAAGQYGVEVTAAVAQDISTLLRHLFAIPRGGPLG